MAYRILQHPDIRSDLLSIASLISDYAGARVAREKLKQIRQTVAALSTNPHIGTIRHEIYPDLRVIPVAKKGVITFTVNDRTQTIFLISITYAGADWLRGIDRRV